MPTNFEVSGIFFTALRTDAAGRDRVTLLELPDYVAPFFNIFRLFDPDLGIRYGQLTQAALRILIEYFCLNAGSLQAVQYKMRLRKIGRCV